MRSVLLALLVLLSPAVFAAFPYMPDKYDDGEYATPQAACQAVLDAARDDWRSKWSAPDGRRVADFTFNGVQQVTSSPPEIYTCLYEIKYAVYEGGIKDQSSVTGVGVNAVPWEECVSGNPDVFQWPLGRKDSNAPNNIAPGTEIPPPSWACSSGCKVNRTSGVDGCYNFDGEGAVTYCDYKGEQTGETCNTSDTPQPDVPEVPPDPCDTNPQGEGCSGGGDPGGGDPGGGDPGGGDPGGGDPGGGDPGGGDPGGGDPGGGDPGGGDNGGSAGGFANCDAPLSCEGDAIACAQLYLQKEQYCDGLEQSDFLGQQDDIADFLDQPDFEAEEDEEINLSEMFSEGTRFLPSSCPQAKSFSLTTNGGRTFSLSFEPLCQFASDLSYLIVAAAAVFYALYVGRAVGGE
ncbi:virulence factor TspB C-terminal domain-related protein [Pseudomonas sp. PDM15]|uniref:virulence factor TspB C-terminal domain-related protein n=1 Tax=Pseudomonas sp. PDM15 TaxID=2769303 RepID=UPI001CE06737|nr:virulence factor TspB C-terminal domain-related protein [Pseudomonas sp. PDM15]